MTLSNPGDALAVITAALEHTGVLSEAKVAEDIMSALERAGFVVLDECARCHEDPRSHWCADLEETFN